MPLRNRQPPRIDVPRRQIREALLLEHHGCLAEQPAQLRDRHPLGLTQIQELIEQLTKRDRGRTSTGTEPRELPRERLLRLRAAREAAHLWPRRAAPLEPVAVRPKRFAVGALRLQLEHLALLNHRDLLDRRPD